MARLAALVANGGTLWQPYVVSHVGTPGSAGYQNINSPTIAADLIADKTLTAAALETVQAGLCLVTTDKDLGTAYRIFGDAAYAPEVCGKTGTAETSNAITRAPPHAWFIAYYPKEAPELAIAGVMAHSREGSEVVAPIIRRIFDDYLGQPQKAFPEWWQGPYEEVKTAEQVAAAAS